MLDQNYTCEGQMDIFDFLEQKEDEIPKKSEYKSAIGCVDNICYQDGNSICNRYGEGYRECKPHKYYSCSSCCFLCEAYKTKCEWECKVRRVL